MRKEGISRIRERHRETESPGQLSFNNHSNLLTT